MFDPKTRIPANAGGWFPALNRYEGVASFKAAARSCCECLLLADSSQPTVGRFQPKIALHEGQVLAPPTNYLGQLDWYIHQSTSLLSGGLLDFACGVRGAPLNLWFNKNDSTIPEIQQNITDHG